MQGINRVTLLGNLGLDPELRHTRAGVPVCNIRLATNEVFTDSDGMKQTSVEWHNVTIWGTKGVAAHQKLVKGCTIWLEGRLESHRYTNRDGQETRSWNVVVNRIVYVTTKDDFEFYDEDDDVSAEASFHAAS